MPQKKLPASRFARVPKVIKAIELVYLPKRIAIFMNKERQEAAGWSANTPKPVIAFKVKSPRQASETAAKYLVQLSQQGHQVAVAKDIKQLTTVTKDPSAPASVDEPVEDGEDKGVDKRTSFVRKLILQAFREQKKEKSEGIMSDGHEHLHRLVEANEQEQAAKRDPLHTFRVLSGVRSVRPSLEEALTGVTEHEKRLEEGLSYVRDADHVKVDDDESFYNVKIGKDLWKQIEALLDNPNHSFQQIAKSVSKGEPVHIDRAFSLRDWLEALQDIAPKSEKAKFSGPRQDLAKAIKKYYDDRPALGKSNKHTSEGVVEEWGSDPLPHHGLAKVMPGQSKKKGKPMTVTTHTGGKTTMRTVSEQKGYLTTKRAVVESAHGEKVSQAAACAKKAWAKALKGKDPKNARSAVWKAVKAEFPEFESDTKLMNSLVDDTKPKH